MPYRDGAIEYVSEPDRCARPSVGMQCVTLCVTKEDAERPERHADAERRTIVVSKAPTRHSTGVSFSDSEQFVLHRVFDEIGQ
ncbi:hypothetical protein PSE10B_30760 [Pseudomonas amygdali pv. eriobotryae]|uniref:Uncharacterized protein n=1 Tax=Pseudomonas amygdali pv. eriobotryae TaxID=129137 RepID=A0A9P3ABA7_PSEA0|nr:hypothetical protein PSE10A_15210 [Pseudomonas amygdali pv. eriobotryae]GFZ66554.1 hypothetical protein PSE10B_30760 [Pseudomonas amygdali pv. eriobotryae]GFZ70326.1 hypothetical protein PSE10C_10680 [Pseudomonas amygdali pv. eriobotryae]